MKKQMMKMVIGLALTLVSYSAFAGEVKVQYNCKTNFTETCAVLKDVSKYSRQHSLGWKVSSEVTRESVSELIGQVLASAYRTENSSQLKDLMYIYEKLDQAMQSIIARELQNQFDDPAYEEAVQGLNAITRGIISGMAQVHE